MSFGGSSNSSEDTRTEPNHMNSTLTQQILIGFYHEFGTMVRSEVPNILLIIGALTGLYWGLSKLLKGMGGSGTTSWLGQHWAWYDRMTYKPWKGYNRLRSRSWNMRHAELDTN